MVAANSLTPPKVKYRTCLNSWFTLEGQAYQVKMAESYVVRRWLQACAVDHPSILQSIMKELRADNYSAVTRWWAILRLLENGISLKLFATREQAIASQCLSTQEQFSVWGLLLCYLVSHKARPVYHKHMRGGYMLLPRYELMPDSALTSNQLIIKRIRLERMEREAQRRRLKSELKVLQGGKLTKETESESK